MHSLCYLCDIECFSYSGNLNWNQDSTISPDSAKPYGGISLKLAIQIIDESDSSKTVGLTGSFEAIGHNPIISIDNGTSNYSFSSEQISVSSKVLLILILVRK